MKLFADSLCSKWEQQKKIFQSKLSYKMKNCDVHIREQIEIIIVKDVIYHFVSNSL
jgi:hypothetical protein